MRCSLNSESHRNEFEACDEGHPYRLTNGAPYATELNEAT